MKTGRVNTRLLTECIISFFIGRVILFSMSVPAEAVFVIALTGKKRRNPVIAAVFAGMVTSYIMPLSLQGGGNIIKYSLVFASVIIIERLAYVKKTYMGFRSITYLTSGVSTLLGISGGMFDTYENICFSLGEGILIIVFANLLYKGMYLIRYGRISQALSNEQLISVVLMLSLAINGMPEAVYDVLSIRECGMFMLVLCMAYKYGASAGAIAGAAAGIAAGAYGDNIALVGLYCIVGIAAGIVCDMGKLASIVVFTASGIAAGLLYPSELWNVWELKAFLSAAAGFVFIPKTILAVNDSENEEDNVLVKNNVRQEMSVKLLEFAGAFENLGETFAKHGEERPVINTMSVGRIFNELTGSVCGACSNCHYCWEQKYYDTYHETIKMLGSAEKGGRISRADVSVDFAARCMHFDDFMRETNKQLEIMRISEGWINRFAQNRSLIAEQMKEISKLIGELEKDISATKRKALKEEEEILALLRSYGIKVKKLLVLEKRDNRTEICITAKAGGNICMTSREMADIISGVMKKRWRAYENVGCVIPKEYKELVFVEDVRYRLLTGVARISKNGEMVSGDNYSVLTLPNGRVVMTITDGMGSGMSAYDESETVIEMIEQLIEAGFTESMALRFVNSTLVFSHDEENFSTADICVIDLNNGMCECIKCGAAATYIKKKNEVRIIHADTMPIGILPEAKPESSRCRLASGDMVIMLSDGVIDSMPGGEPESVIKNIIEICRTSNPQEMAEMILKEAQKGKPKGAVDDMSVLVAGLWYKV